MRKPEDIQKDIDLLKNELNESIKFYEYELLCNSEWTCDMIGFFNLGNARKILKELYDGSTLQYRHSVYGIIKEIKMNPQKNRILVSDDSKNINENNIMTFIVWANGEWYKKIEKHCRAEQKIYDDCIMKQCMKCGYYK